MATEAGCSFLAFYEDCCKHVDFLQGSLRHPQLMEDVVLKYAVIYALIRVGENLTFLRDDPEFSYRKEWEKYQATADKTKTPLSHDMKIIVRFIYFRNQLLHHSIYNTGQSLQEIVNEVLRGRFGQSADVDELRALLSKIKKIGDEIGVITLTKPVGPAPIFLGTIQNCVDALKTEAIALDAIVKKGGPSLNLAKRGALLRCFQIISDLQNAPGIHAFFNTQIHADFDDLFDKAKQIRGRLAHVLSYSPREVEETHALLETFNSVNFLQFVNAATTRLQEIRETNTELVSSRQASAAVIVPQQITSSLSSVPETPKPITDSPHKPFSLPLGCADKVLPASPRTPQTPEPIPSMLESTKRLVDYPDSDSSDEEKIDKEKEKRDTKKRKAPDSPSPSSPS